MRRSHDELHRPYFLRSAVSGSIGMRADRAAVARRVGGLEQRVVDRFFGGVEHRFEQARDRVGGEDRPRLRAVGVGEAQRRVRRERDGEIAAAVRVGRARPRQREDGARREPFEVARVERRIGRDDDHAGAVGSLGVRLAFVVRAGIRLGSLRVGGGLRRQLPPHGHAGDGQAPAVVRLHEHADGPLVVLLPHASRRGADAAFPPERHGSRAGADGAFLDGAVARRGDGRR